MNEQRVKQVAMNVKQALDNLKRGTVEGVKWATRPAGGAVAAAVEYLTCCPAWWAGDYSRDDIERSPDYFPLVGVLLGVLAGLVIWVFGWFSPPVVLSVLGVAVLMKSTGAQGSLGLATAFADYFKSPLRRKVDQPLADSPGLSGGAFLAFAVVAGKMIMLASLTPWQCARAVLLVAVAGRCCMHVGMALCPCVAADGSLERVFWKHGSGNALIVSLVTWGAVAILFLWTVGLFAFVIAVGYAMVFSLVCKKMFGGLDGKSLFALSDVCEFVTILILAIGY
ncbi:MAG: adenosylcobinamide-GDP ribazoletransferase [Lentisphaeria bacterium]|nr:adenosylcobinamide-GDP ribazoletransferase [Lentisphaeria bacterium]